MVDAPELSESDSSSPVNQDKDVVDARLWVCYRYGRIYTSYRLCLSAGTLDAVKAIFPLFRFSNDQKRSNSTNYVVGSVLFIFGTKHG